MAGMKGRICIIDHDQTDREFLKTCLEREGHEVLAFDKGPDIDPAFSEKHFNIFILNIDTPGVREKNLLFKLKKCNPSRILLILSERGDPFLKEANDLGVYGCIYKPFSLEEVCTMVHHLSC